MDSAPSAGASPGAASTWSSLFSSEVMLHFVAPTLKNGKKSVLISKSVFDKGAFLCGDCLVGQFFRISPKLVVI